MKKVQMFQWLGNLLSHGPTEDAIPFVNVANESTVMPTE